VPITRLTKIFRQAAKSMTIQAAYAINSGKAPVADPQEASKLAGFDVTQDYFYVPIAIKRPEQDPETGEVKMVDDTNATNQEIVRRVVDFACHRIPRRYGFDPVEDVQVMAPMASSRAGVDELNFALQAALNPDGDPIAECNKKRFRIGDKILNTKNNYDHDIMNGEFARIIDYIGREQLVVLESDGREIRMGAGDVEQNFVLAYAVTVHKMQGSSAKAVVMPMSKSFHNMLTRNLFYTAVTRTEQVCVVIGHPQAVQVAVSTKDTSNRNTALGQRLLHPSLSGQLV
jgi:exodeoxyribonuclease V alpha subunit